MIAQEPDDFALRNLFSASDGEDCECENGEISIETIGGVSYTLRCAENDGGSPASLFAYNVWSGSVQLAEYLSNENGVMVQGKQVVELGAAAALPSLVALSYGAANVMITDYPNDMILQVIRRNIDENMPFLGTDVNNRCKIEGHLWGNVIGQDDRGRYDIALLAECLWCHAQHFDLLCSLQSLLKEGGLVLLSYAHHIPGKEDDDDAFFALAQNQFGFEEIRCVETREMRYMWDADKTISQFLFTMRKRRGLEITNGEIL